MKRQIRMGLAMFVFPLMLCAYAGIQVDDGHYSSTVINSVMSASEFKAAIEANKVNVESFRSVNLEVLRPGLASVTVTYDNRRGVRCVAQAVAQAVANATTARIEVVEIVNRSVEVNCSRYAF